MYDPTEKPEGEGEETASDETQSDGDSSTESGDAPADSATD